MFSSGDYDWSSFAIGLIVGGCVALFLGWRRRNQRDQDGK
jgi:hypothetical protein